jgi:hypothetical protein
MHFHVDRWEIELTDLCKDFLVAKKLFQSCYHTEVNINCFRALLTMKIHAKCFKLDCRPCHATAYEI